jgi:hypothetical protein
MTSARNALTGWWQTVLAPDSPQAGKPYSFRLLKDATLRNPDRPYETCSADDIQALRIASGHEPAIRTVVHSDRTGHTVQFYLLQNHRHSNTIQPNPTLSMEARNVSHVKEKV